MAAFSGAPDEMWTDRLYMRRLRYDDIEELHKIRMLPEVMQWTSALPASDISNSQEWLDKVFSRPNCYNFVVQLRDAEPQENGVKRVIGCMGSHSPPAIGYIFHAEFHGKGYATEALRAFVEAYWKHVPEAGTDTWGYDYARADADRMNKPSIRVMEKSGFVFWQAREKDFESPMLGWRDTVSYLIPRPGKSLEGQMVEVPNTGQEKKTVLIEPVGAATADTPEVVEVKQL